MQLYIDLPDNCSHIFCLFCDTIKL